MRGMQLFELPGGGVFPLFSVPTLRPCVFRLMLIILYFILQGTAAKDFDPLHNFI
jgi:hypothetical protein